ncbi:MAG TPA: isochorismatase family cysteine hydrolase [Galbitalea sp.]|jgi:nicotinamidase-related amidase|nr:isochorismatase family cysteine hydrolase [Galbitalea sp.]
MTWRSDVEALPNFAPATFDIDAARTALVIVDMQYLDAHPDYGLGEQLKESHPDVWRYYTDRLHEFVVPNCARLLTFFRDSGMRVVFVTIGPVLADGMDMLPLRRPRTAPGLQGLLHHQGTFEHEILAELAPVEGELVINKTSRSAFNSTAIERVLLNLGAETLIVAGVTTSSCIDTTARDAADRGFKTVIVEDATAELDEASHEATLRQFAVRWGRVWTTAETLEQLGPQASEGKRGSVAAAGAAPPS